MANEIRYSGQSGLTGVYAVIRNATGQVYNRNANAFEDWLNESHTSNYYAIGLTEKGQSGGEYIEDFDVDSDGAVALPYGHYKVEVFDTNDIKIGVGWILWSGTAEIFTDGVPAAIVPAGYLGDYKIGETLYFAFTTTDKYNNEGAGIKVFKNSNTTPLPYQVPVLILKCRAIRIFIQSLLLSVMQTMTLKKIIR